MLHFAKNLDKLTKDNDTVILIGSYSTVRSGLFQKQLPELPWNLLEPALQDLKPGPKPQMVKTLTGQKLPKRVTVAVLPDDVSRGFTASKKPWLFQATEDVDSAEKAAVIVALENREHHLAATTAVARRLRSYTAKSQAKKAAKTTLCAMTCDGEVLPGDATLEAAAASVIWAASMIDMPPQECNPKQFSKHIRNLFKDQERVTADEIVGDKLKEDGFGGIYNVGRAAPEEPRLVVIDYKPKGATKTVVLVGKGITYDTGGLALKPRNAMSGMKADMSGAAVVAAATHALVASQFPHRVIALVAIAENAIGPNSYRNDDVLSMYSGKTVEINNTDAEGRLLLADALAYAAKEFSPDLIIDAATLTGAQGVATGLHHAGFVTNDAAMEKLLLEVGETSGDMVFPMLFSPELLTDEFVSEIADLKNSVADATNAPSSAAGIFLYQHLGDHQTKPWIHIDLAFPVVSKKGLGTGYGVGLLTSAVRKFCQ